MRKIWYHHSRMGLSLYDSVGQGYLRESVMFNSVLISMELIFLFVGFGRLFI